MRTLESTCRRMRSSLLFIFPFFGNTASSLTEMSASRATANVAANKAGLSRWFRMLAVLRNVIAAWMSVGRLPWRLLRRPFGNLPGSTRSRTSLCVVAGG